MTNSKQKCIIYIGDFDLRNQNVQAHLVRNNATILNRLGYKVAFIGVNREASINEIDSLPKLNVGEENSYLELSNTLTIKGLLQYRMIVKTIIAFLDVISQSTKVSAIISYQAPTYAPVLKKIVSWCRKHGAKYIVNCADITIFNSQPLLRRLVMTLNWKYLHRVNKKNADGLIAVSSFIERFYHKDGMPSIIIPPLFNNTVDTSYQLNNKITFVYAGTPFVMKRKVNVDGMKDRLDKIVEYCIHLSNEKIEYRLLIIGVTKELYLDCIPQHRDALIENNDIIFCGRRSHNDTLIAVKNADYMLNYRDKNIMNEAGLSTKLVESVSLGTPVVMNSIGDSFRYLREGITGFELTGDFDRDVVLLQSLCNKTKDERMVLKQECAGDKTFAIERYETKFGEFLNEVLSN